MSEVLHRSVRPVPFWHPGSATSDSAAPALVVGTDTLSHADLADRVRQRGPARGRVPASAASCSSRSSRRSTASSPTSPRWRPVTWCCSSAPGRADSPGGRLGPDDRATRVDGAWAVSHGTARGRHDLHPDLPLLLSTSGSTGSPKLVRLSADAVRANAVDIAAALGLDASDRAVTTLPLHYCYGLSVLHSHLAVGRVGAAHRRLGDRPRAVVGSMRSAGVTSLAGVPHTFELLESSGAPTGSVPTLRQVTQAGGRLDPARVRAWAERGRREGWDLRVMYGQTEATARMAVTAPGAAAQDPASVGSRGRGGPVQRARRRRATFPRGWWATCTTPGRTSCSATRRAPTTSGAAATSPTSPTGDLARLRADGTLEVVGRRASFLKVNGIRAGRRAGRAAAGRRRGSPRSWAGPTSGCSRWSSPTTSGPAAPRRCGGRSTTLVASHRPARPPDRRWRRSRRCRGTPTASPTGRRSASTVDLLADDGSHAAAAGVDRRPSSRCTPSCWPGPTPPRTRRFVDLGGDSLSYVELSLHLEERLGPLPADWPLRPIRSLATDEPPRRRRMARVDTTIVLRAVAILAIVGSHTHVVHVLGGAHVLLGVAGYNFARFAATAPTVRETWRRVGGTVARIAVPSVVWVAAVGLLAGTYSVANLGMVNWLFGSDTWSSTWRLWFLEALAWTLVAFAALLSVPPVRRLYARHPFAAGRRRWPRWARWPGSTSST